MTDSADNRLGRRQPHVKEDETFLRWFVIPEKDRAKFTTAPWDDGYRWLRSYNVTALGKSRRSPITVIEILVGENEGRYDHT
jgi:hypothetical protein